MPPRLWAQVRTAARWKTGGGCRAAHRTNHLFLHPLQQGQRLGVLHWGDVRWRAPFSRTSHGRLQATPERRLFSGQGGPGLAKNKQEKQLEKMISEFGGAISEEKFRKAYDIAIKEDFDNLTISFGRLECETMRFRRNLNEFIIDEENLKSCKCRDKKSKRKELK